MDIDALMTELGETSQAALARRLGVAPSLLSDIKRGDRKVTIKLAAAIERETGRPGAMAEALSERIG